MPPHSNKSHDPMVIHLKSPGAARQQVPPTPAPGMPEHIPPVSQVRSQKRSRRLYPRTIAMVLVAVAVFGGGGYYYVSQSQTQIHESVPADESAIPLQRELQSDDALGTSAAPVTGNQVVAQAARHLLLPTGESPTIATVSDLEVLKGQEFFKNAQIGDVVLMFAKARRAVLYSPSQDKIIEVAPITTDMQKP